MGSNAPSDDDSDGDLGLGDGLKPGALPLLPDSFSESCCEKAREIGPVSADTSVRQTPQFSQYEFSRLNNADSDDGTQSDSGSDFELTLQPIKPIQELKLDYCSKEPSRRSTETFPPDLSDEKAFGNCLLDCDKDRNNKVEFPVFADIPYGTSIRQQKELFHQNIEELKKKHSGSRDMCNIDHSRSKNLLISVSESKTGELLSGEEIAMELAKRLQEVEELKIELETCESRLDSKYKAIDILRKQAEDAQVQLKASEKMSKETTVKLAQEVNKLQFQLHCRESSILESQQVWLDRFNRVCKENASLLSGLEARTEELRKVTSQKMAVERENDELLALLDIQERAKYEKSRSISSEDEYCTYNSTELAILGACRCRIISPNPCGCAHAAANLKKEVVRYKEQIIQYKNRRDEAFLTVDAYRKAFEEQLERNKALTLQLASVTTSSPSKTSKTKQALRWLIGSLNDDGTDDESDSQTSNGPMMSEHEFITYLIEMLHEKKEVLAHQKLTSQILGDRLKTAEEKLLKYEAKDEVFS